MQKLSLFLITLLLAGFTSCKYHSSQANNEGTQMVQTDLDSILQRGTMRVLTDYNSVNYFVYKGFPVGYQFEMLKALCDYMGITLEIKVANNREDNIRMLLSGEADLIATNLSVVSKDAGRIAYTLPHSQSRQILVQRAWEKDEKGHQKTNKLIRNERDLVGKTIYVQNNSSYSDRLRQISILLDDSLQVVEVPDYDVEQLMQLVAEGELTYTLCYENIAKVNKSLYPNLDIKTVMSDDCNLSWAVRPNSQLLLDIINRWLADFKESGQYQRIYRRYFVNYHPIRMGGDRKTSYVGEHNAIYDDIIKAYASNSKFDWRLIASVIYQESRFDPDAESWAGAIGLMQLMPETAKLFGVETINNPQENIEGGIRFLDWLDERMQRFVPNKKERVKFVLASYNVGIGHVIDAIKLAGKFGKDTMVWDNNVDLFLLNKSNPVYYRDPVVKYGYCRGDEPYNYVREIIRRYDYYKTTLN